MFERLSKLGKKKVVNNQITHNTTSTSLNPIYKKSQTVFLKEYMQKMK